MMQDRLYKAKEMVYSFYQEYDSGHPMFTEEDIEILNWLIKQAEKVERYENELNEMNCDIPGMIESKTFDYKEGYYRLLKMVQNVLKS